MIVGNEVDNLRAYADAVEKSGPHLFEGGTMSTYGIEEAGDESGEAVVHYCQEMIDILAGSGKDLHAHIDGTFATVPSKLFPPYSRKKQLVTVLVQVEDAVSTLQVHQVQRL